ncbi:transcriptional regulator, LysR family [Parafrankia sp. EUN1f]|nr:transcriptional regulator, LysR family [Parafrankia sp. EUN1f]
MPPVVRTLRESYPHIAVRAEDLPIAALVAGLREGRLDAALTRPPLVDDLESEVVLREPVAAVLPVGHPLAGRDELRVADLADEPWVLTPSHSWPPWHRKYETDFRRAGFSPRIVERGTSPQGLLALVAAGVGVTRLPCSSRSLRDSGVVFVPLADDEAEVVLVRWAGGAPPHRPSTPFARWSTTSPARPTWPPPAERRPSRRHAPRGARSAGPGRPLGGGSTKLL